MKRWLALLAAALLLVTTSPLPAAAEDDHGEHEREHVQREHDRSRATPPVAPAPAQPQATPPSLPAAQPAAPAAPGLSALTTAVTVLAADPASTALQTALRRAAASAGTQAPGLWVEGDPVSGALLPGKRLALVSLDLVSGPLGVKLSPDPAGGAVTIVFGGHESTVKAGADTITVDGRTVAVDEPAVLGGTTLYISLRTLAEVTGCQVIYDEVTGMVLVSVLH